MKKSFKYIKIAVLVTVTAISGCQKGDLLSNPNVAAENATVPVSLLLNHLTSNLTREEEPVISTVYRYNQDLVSNYSYYFGSNAYNWSNTNNTYDMIRYCNQLESQAKTQYGNTTNVYFALSKFFRAYAFIWMSQRVGDIPMSQAGDINNLTPVYDKQHDVYKNSLALLDAANTMMGTLMTTPGVAASKVDANGDIFGLTYLQWRKVINTYRLRVLISLSKRADDNADLNIKSQFATIIGDPVNYPIMTSTDDNMVYRYTTVTLYPPNRSGNAPYNNCANISQTFFNVTATYHDPRVFVLAIPAAAQLTAGKQVSDFTAYVGEDNSKSQGLMSSFSADGKYSSLSYNRYMSSATGANAEPYVLVGYPELCFNIAEAAYRGWITADPAAWYLNGINASMKWYGLSQGQTVTIGNVDGTKPSQGTATIDIASFLANPNVAYNPAQGLTQILTQKYVAFFMNSGFEAYYNWRRTGIPTFSQGGAGIGTANNMIPMRWQYPQDEITYNNANYQSAITSQYSGTDDINGKMWLIK
ncbi:SusD/RagB family nutrient-binding outer membrane lipoprotein [Chitinophaga eiseniae]|uniref:SusD/RagB family nutrient-binding outer membrane lipoprotein n=1 Tax=Chitinophaga eiseniae TaxID=634771 RepID=A0A847SS23_9BACT|nr:SusD/RagB family nutrient-binding outer membrane lipoprotein [Chitinophaga eiseniae]NLR82943.1 SusD/RagB family nutrient-binding outer membrane lipoprotein [Chitinophaga eiseniae]